MARKAKAGHVHAPDDEEELLLLDPKPLRATQSKVPQKPSKKPVATDDSETDNSDDDMHVDQAPPKNAQPLPTPVRSVSPAVDPGRAPGRIIGTTYPLDDFEKNISQGDVVSKAVEDLGFVIKEIVVKPFTSRRHDELLKCMSSFRDVALKVDGFS